eukprot:TRINITY_DN19221_c0_g1_i1.p1 TRINITY_DN19221_c0_g1~~TRINITY_DN19221_c0_g1_i1.p1  ORF type:complete len:774 (+),score=235.41 TRINITY_DN19221_c0_g1_i1:115-2436(+)
MDMVRSGDPLLAGISTGIARTGPVPPQTASAADIPTITPGSPAVAVVVIERGAAVRELEDPDSQSRGTLPYGTAVEVFEVRGRRARMRSLNPPTEGWVSVHTVDGSPILAFSPQPAGAESALLDKLQGLQAADPAAAGRAARLPTEALQAYGPGNAAAAQSILLQQLQLQAAKMAAMGQGMTPAASLLMQQQLAAAQLGAGDKRQRGARGRPPARGTAAPGMPGLGSANPTAAMLQAACLGQLPLAGLSPGGATGALPEDANTVQMLDAVCRMTLAELLMRPRQDAVCATIERCLPPQLLRLLKHLQPMMPQLAADVGGAAVLMQCVQCSSLPAHWNVLRSALGQYVIGLMKNTQGNRIIAKMLQRMPLGERAFIYEALATRVFDVATDKNGVIALSRAIECATAPQMQAITEEMLAKVRPLSRHPYGNYIVQHLLSLGNPARNAFIRDSVIGELADLSMQKHSSPVVESCFKHGSADDRQMLVNALCTLDRRVLAAIVSDQYGNYVIQTILANATNEQMAQLDYAIRPLLAQSPYRKHILGKLDAGHSAKSSAAAIGGEAAAAEPEAQRIDLGGNPSENASISELMWGKKSSAVTKYCERLIVENQWLTKVVNSKAQDLPGHLVTIIWRRVLELAWDNHSLTDEDVEALAALTPEEAEQLVAISPTAVDMRSNLMQMRQWKQAAQVRGLPAGKQFPFLAQAGEKKPLATPPGLNAGAKAFVPGGAPAPGAAPAQKGKGGKKVTIVDRKKLDVRAEPFQPGGKSAEASQGSMT